MKNGSMFGTLVRYRSQNYYDEHPTLYYLTPKRTFRIELIAGFVTSSAGEVYDTQLSAEQVRQLCAQSGFKSRVTPRTEMCLLRCLPAAMSMRMRVML